MLSYFLSELGNGWGSTLIESEQEWNFIEENLRTDQEQDYFIGGSYYNQSHFEFFDPTYWFNSNFSVRSYSTRQQGNDLFC